MSALSVLGRLGFGGYFLYNGINHFRNHTQLAPYAEAKKVPAADVAVQASGALLVFGGASLISGIKPKWGAAAIATFLGAVSPVMHDFWNVEDPAERQGQQINFTKNMALLGAALFVIGLEEECKSNGQTH